MPVVGAIHKIETTAGTVAGKLAGCDFVGNVAVVGGTVAVVTRIVAKEEEGSVVAVEQGIAVGVLASVLPIV